MRKTWIAGMIAAVVLAATTVCFAEENKEAVAFENSGITLSIPGEYAEKLVVEDAPEDGSLFKVSEKASIEAAKAQGMEYDGPGWLFSIGTVPEDEAHMMLCGDMSGADIFAKDAENNYYVFYHPTDVRLVRENYDDPAEMEGWSELNEWAATVQDTLVAENEGLTAEKFGNSEVEIALFNTVYGDKNYTISTLEHGPLEPGDVDPMPFVEKLTTGVKYEYAEETEAPDGEYAVLTFPEESARFDFFFAEGGENFVRKVTGEGDDEFVMLYKATFEDGTTKASEIMKEWYDAIVAAAGVAEE